MRVCEREKDAERHKVRKGSEEQHARIDANEDTYKDMSPCTRCHTY